MLPQTAGVDTVLPFSRRYTAAKADLPKSNTKARHWTMSNTWPSAAFKSPSSSPGWEIFKSSRTVLVDFTFPWSRNVFKSH